MRCTDDICASIAATMRTAWRRKADSSNENDSATATHPAGSREEEPLAAVEMASTATRNDTMAERTSSRMDSQLPAKLVVLYATVLRLTSEWWRATNCSTTPYARTLVTPPSSCVKPE